jgi:hypothetical protein
MPERTPAPIALPPDAPSWAATLPGIPGFSVAVHDNPFGLDPALLFGLARRVNPKRSALFVSLVLGKHVPVDPAVSWVAGLALAHRYRAVVTDDALAVTPREIAAALVDPVAAAALVPRLRAGAGTGARCTVLGFAETATALGHAVRDGIPGALGAHSTRLVEVDRPPRLAFEESHSHAPDHRIVTDLDVLDHDGPLVLVDDELTTGRTALNTIAAVHAHHPRDRYAVCTLLDWRGPAERQAFAAAESVLGARIDVVALLAGRADVGPDPGPAAPAPEPDPGVALDARGSARVRWHRFPHAPRVTGRHRFDPADADALDAFAAEVALALDGARGDGRTLVLGTEELMYTPMRVAAALGDLGPAARRPVWHSTTRSPISVRDVDGYAVRHGVAFADPGEPERASRCYNLAPGAYGDVCIVVEGPVAEAAVAPMLAAVVGTGTAPRVHVVELGSGE